MTFETFDQSDEETWPDRKVWIFWIYLWNFSGDNDDNEDNKDNEDSEDNKENEDREDNRDNEDSEENDNSEDNDIEKTPWILEICETLITFLAIENNNLIIHNDPWIKSERDSIRNSCDVYSINPNVFIFGSQLRNKLKTRTISQQIIIIADPNERKLRRQFRTLDFRKYCPFDS